MKLRAPTAGEVATVAGVTGSCSIVTGVFLLIGSGAAFIAGGLFLLAFAFMITRGIAING